MTDDARLGKKIRTFMEIAKTLGNLGTCDRKQVGAVIIRDGRCISWGFNGAPAGLPHCDENGHGWDEWLELHDTGKLTRGQLLARMEKKGCRNATHAEANALAAAAKQGISTDGAELFVTVAPCETCARLIIAAGIVRVYYSEEYRKDDGCRLLQTASIESLQLS